MKKIALKTMFAVAAFSAACGSAYAAQTTVCARATAAHAGTSPAYGTAGTNFMVTQITPKCSANILAIGIDGTAAAWYTVVANSNKGKTTYGASTGGHQGTTACGIPGGCTDAEVTTQLSISNTGT